MIPRPFVLALVLPLLLGTSCKLLASFFIANLSSHAIHVQYSVPCRPNCPSPTVIGVRTLKHEGGWGSIHGSRPAPAGVQGRVDSLVTYSLDLPPDTAVCIFDGGAPFSGKVRDFEDQFPNVRIIVDTGQSARSFEGRALADSFRMWHRLVHVFEVR